MIESKIGLRREEGEAREGRGGEGTGVVLAGTWLLRGPQGCSPATLHMDGVPP